MNDCIVSMLFEYTHVLMEYEHSTSLNTGNLIYRNPETCLIYTDPRHIGVLGSRMHVGGVDSSAA